jgi:hypothetical protein
MRDLPTGPALLNLARDVLLDELMPLLPQEARLDARLVANSIAIAGREAEAADAMSETITRELEKFYGGEKSKEEAGDLLRRLAADLRIGVFENSRQQEDKARQIIWRLTIAKLRQANPRFLAANGFG